MSLAAALCISVGAATITLPASSFTLAWRHTIEKIVWEEDYQVAGGWLFLTRARIRGSGAGMEPPADAVRIDDAWVYRPADPWRRKVELAHSEFGGDYRLCVAGRCRPLAQVVGGRTGPLTLAACAPPPAGSS